MQNMSHPVNERDILYSTEQIVSSTSCSFTLPQVSTDEVLKSQLCLPEDTSPGLDLIDNKQL